MAHGEVIHRPFFGLYFSVGFRFVVLEYPKSVFLRLSVDISSETEAIHLQNVVRHAHHRPFRPHFFNSTQEKLSEASRMFDLPEYRFDDRLSPRIDRRTGFRLKLASHTIDPCRPFGSGPRLQAFFSPCFCLSVATYASISCFSRCSRFCSEQYPLSANNSSGFCPDCLFNGFHHRRHLLLVVGFLRDRLRNNQLRSCFPRRPAHYRPAQNHPRLS